MPIAYVHIFTEAQNKIVNTLVKKPNTLTKAMNTQVLPRFKTSVCTQEHGKINTNRE